MNLKSRKDEFVKRIEDITSVVIDKVVKKNTISLTDTPSHFKSLEYYTRFYWGSYSIWGQKDQKGHLVGFIFALNFGKDRDNDHPTVHEDKEDQTSIYLHVSLFTIKPTEVTHAIMHCYIPDWISAAIDFAIKCGFITEPPEGETPWWVGLDDVLNKKEDNNEPD